MNRLKSLPYNQKVAPYVFVAPFIIVFLVFFIYPLISTIIMSFQEVLPGQTHFVGLKNYEFVFKHGELKKAIGNSAIYTLITCAVLIPVPLLLAVFLDSKKMPAKNFFRGTLFLPALVCVVVGGFTFRLIFGELPTALLNSVLGKFGVAPRIWLAGKKQWTTFLALLVLCCWRWMGVNVMYYLSAIQSISSDLYESADIDGANAWHKFRYITVPLVKPTTIYVLTISIYGGLAMFLESYMLFGGVKSPGNAGLTIVGYLYRLGLQENKIGIGCAVGLVLLVMTLIINMIQLTATGFFKKGE